MAVLNPSAVQQLADFRAGLTPHELRLLESERRAACEVLGLSPGSPSILAAARGALVRGEAVRQHHLQVIQPSRVIACHEGCHWCCHLKVSATAPEVLVLADYLRTSATAEVLETAKRRAAELAQDVRIFSADDKAEAKIPCALLTDAGACAAYEARPLACRGWNALDPESCRLELEDDSVFGERNEELGRECAAVGLGLVAALADAHLPTEILELTSALHVALSEPNALERWVSGEPIFDGSRADRRA
ncbi:MAG: YkgJ family cysteine cluster protein [Polyangiaceae bacterium]